MQAVALLKVIVLETTAAQDFVIRVRESAGVTKHVGSTGTVVKTFN